MWRRSFFRSASFIPWCLLVVFTAIYFSSTVGVSNSLDGPDYALTRAIVEQRTTQIGSYPQWITPDYAMIDNRAYAKRSPGLSLIGVPFYIMALVYSHLATAPYNWQHDGLNSDSPTEALAMIFPALCGACTVVLFYLICLTLTRHRLGSLLAAVSLGLGTLLWRYSISYQRMPLYMLLLTLLYYLAITFRAGDARNSKVFFIGFVMGFLLVTESTSIFVLPIYGLWFARKLLLGNPVSGRGRQQILLLAAGSFAGLSVLFAYNLYSFQQLYINLYQAGPGTRWETFSALFSTPLWPSIALNLFSHAPIPYNSLSPVLQHHPYIFNQQSAHWALQTEYDGLVFQSPYFGSAAVGLYFFVRERTAQAMLALGSAAVVLIVMSKFVTFYSATLFDGRYFTPMLPFLSIGLAYIWKEILELRGPILKLVLASFVVYLTGWSIFNGWVFALTNYGPHVTGNHRFMLSFLGSDRLHNAGLLWTNTFPNVYNLWILLAYAATGALLYVGFQFARDFLQVLTGHRAQAGALRGGVIEP